jgi:hypothetical protein
MEWSRDNRRQRAGKGRKDSNLGPQDDKALPGFRVSSSSLPKVNANLYGSAQGAARKWDQRFESALLQQRVSCEPDLFDELRYKNSHDNGVSGATACVKLDYADRLG